MGKLSLFLFVLFSTTLFSPAHASWKIQKAGFIAKELIKIGTGTKRAIEPADGLFAPSYFDAFAFQNRVEFSGDVVIQEYDEATLSKRITQLQNVFMIMKTVGLNLRAGVIHDAYFPIRGLSGKPISSIFDHTFYGGKIGLGAGFMIGAYPNYSFLRNDAGLRIPNIERILRLDLNVGLELAYIEMDFNPQSLSSLGNGSITITTVNAEVPSKISVRKSLGEVMNQVVGESQ